MARRLSRDGPAHLFVRWLKSGTILSHILIDPNDFPQKKKKDPNERLVIASRNYIWSTIPKAHNHFSSFRIRGKFKNLQIPNLGQNYFEHILNLRKISNSESEQNLTLNFFWI
jgi:hypothetical protein